MSPLSNASQIKTKHITIRSPLRVTLVLLPWLLLIWQNYLAFKFPVKPDRYQHAFVQHLGDRGIAYAQLLRSSFKFENEAMKAETVAQIVSEKSQKYNVDPCLIESIVIYESDFNPNNISTTGAMGLMALMPVTAKKYGVRDPFDPASNVDGGTRLLRDLLETFNGDIDLVLAAYNAGDRAVRELKGVPPYTETIDYVKFVGEIYHSLRLRSEYLANRKSRAVRSYAPAPDHHDFTFSIACSSSF